MTTVVGASVLVAGFDGERLARITDPNGDHWTISSHIEDLTSTR